MARPVVGTKLAGRYDVRALATGSAGYLFRGFDEHIGVEVALRIIDDHLLGDDAERRAFVQKATRAKSLQHPNLIRLYDILVDDTSVFLVMQWAPGERLSQRLAGGTQLEAAEARSILRRVAAGIAHAHQHGVVTGNLRADTIILYPDGLKITNVGTGPALPRERFLAAMSAHRALPDLAPELRAGAELDARADVFSVARLALRLFDVTTLPEPARAVLQRGLVEEVALRPRDVEVFVRELEAAIDGRVLERTPAVPTGYDTERVERLPPLPSEGDVGTRPDVEVLVTDRTQDATVSNGKGSRVVELSFDDLEEVRAGSREGMTGSRPKVDSSPALTDVGRRAPVRGQEVEAEVDAGRFVLDAEPQQPRVHDIPMVRSRTESEASDDDATRPHEKLDVGRAIELPSGEAEPIPLLEAIQAPRQPFAWMPLMLAVAVVVGAVIAFVGIQSAGRHDQQPTVLVMHAPHVEPVVTPVQIPVVTEVAPAVALPPVVASGPCPLGMAALSGAHPYCVDLYEYPGGHTIPRTQVSFHDATAVCQNRGLRLCSDAEWEQACRGPQLASFPYGSSYDPARCNTGGKSTRGAILPAGELARCRSASGAYDMSGNVAEWTSSGAQRGGSAMLAPPNGRCSHAVHMADPKGAPDVGFRCCGDVH
ncbi:MAG: SUMF1/EgtB/PvdO family nonheme iron enzyme [Polyangia bacterium]